MHPVPPAAAQLAQRLRELRLRKWPDARLTQKALATAFSAEERLTAATVSSWESLSAPKPPPPRRLHAYARFFATPRSIRAEPTLLPLEDLTEDELAAYKELEAELFRLRSWAIDEEEAVAFSRSWHFSDTGRVTFVCAEQPRDQRGPLAEPSNPNYTELQAFADVDALMELHGHLRAENPNMFVHFRIPSEVCHDDLTGHIILLGGVVWNEMTSALSEMIQLPVRQVVDPEFPSGDSFAAEVDGEEKKFWPKWHDAEHTLLAEDVGLLARVPNPLNTSRTLTVCNGIHNKGVYGAARSLTDTALRDANERYISTHFGNSDSFVILMSVKIIGNQAITPDFSSPGVVLYQWPQGITA